MCRTHKLKRDLTKKNLLFDALGWVAVILKKRKQDRERGIKAKLNLQL